MRKMGSVPIYLYAMAGDPEDDDLDEDDPPPDDEDEKINDDDGEEIFPIDDPDRNA
jgi:hypothetical protein